MKFRGPNPSPHHCTMTSGSSDSLDHTLRSFQDMRQHLQGSWVLMSETSYVLFWTRNVCGAMLSMWLLSHSYRNTGFTSHYKVSLVTACSQVMHGRDDSFPYCGIGIVGCCRHVRGSEAKSDKRHGTGTHVAAFPSLSLSSQAHMLGGTCRSWSSGIQHTVSGFSEWPRTSVWEAQPPSLSQSRHESFTGIEQRKHITSRVSGIGRPGGVVSASQSAYQ